MRACRLCPRACSADRSAGERGFCGESAVVRAARASLHMWEEPCISGTRGSGTVFFSGCPLRCVYCQNRSIANGAVGKEISVGRLADIMLEQQERGANNINLVTPTHFVPQIAKAISAARRNGLAIPIVYNTSAYETPETLKMLDGLADVYLPDMKYFSPQLAEKYSGAPDYPDTAKAAIAEMVRQAGDPVFAEAGETVEEGIMLRGIIIRHLLLPNGLEDSKAVLRYLHETYGSEIYISIMNQYTPMPEIGERYPELARRVTNGEYDSLVDYAISLGIENGFIQEGETALESFIPEFDMKGI
ncbi:MAG: radical SAM protein [Butyrivibrio sp.]|nr:radical SAM protein [Butyrivibrio sp.]